MRNEQEVLVDVLQRLNRLAVEYMLTGSMASDFWGTPRTTHDLDIVVCLASKWVDPFVDAFKTGFLIQRISVESALKPPFQFNAIDEQSTLKVDFWQLRINPFESEMFRRRRNVNLFGIPAWVATAEDVLLHKLYWNSITPSDRQLLDAPGCLPCRAMRWISNIFASGLQS